MLQRRQDALQFPHCIGLCRQRRLQFVQPMGEQDGVGLRLQRQQRLKIADEETPALKLQLQLAQFEHLAILLAEHRQQDLILQFLLDGPPIDVEKGRVGRAGAVLQDVVPPQVFDRGNAHVVRDDVEDLAQAVAVQRLDQGTVIVGAAQSRVELSEIDHAIAVRAPRARLEAGRSVQVADAQFVEIGGDCGRVAET